MWIQVFDFPMIDSKQARQTAGANFGVFRPVRSNRAGWFCVGGCKSLLRDPIHKTIEELRQMDEMERVKF